jgi:hypothetical protein
VLELLAAGTTMLLSVHLALRKVPAWVDGRDAEGHAVCLVGAHRLRALPAGAEYLAGVLARIAAGTLPEGVAGVAYAPKASAGFAEIVASKAEEVLLHGPRASGKTMAIPGALAWLAEGRARAGLADPLKVLWLHDSLVNAAMKTGRSLVEPMWAGLWQLRDGQRQAAFVLGGVEMVAADFVGCADLSASERLRAACHVVVAEEVVASLDDSAGIELRKYELARSSALRLPTPRRVAALTTNPGAPDSWAFERFLAPGHEATCVAVEVPASDRLTAKEVAALVAAFAGSPDLQRRLAYGEWSELVLGEAVAVGFSRDVHVSAERVRPVPNVALVLGHDGGHTPVTIVGYAYAGEVRVCAALVSDYAGTRQHLDNLVLPWLGANAPWCLQAPSTMLRHYYDPAMETGEQADVDADPVRVLRELLGGVMYPGAVSWPGRNGPLLAIFPRLNPATGRAVLRIDPLECRPLIAALGGRWFYPTVAGKVSRDLPKKPNHPHEDCGDSFCYFLGGIAPSRERPRNSSGSKKASGVLPSVWSSASGRSGYYKNW